MSNTKKILYEQVGGYLKGENQQGGNVIRFWGNHYENVVAYKSFNNTFRPRRIIPREIDDYNQACKIEYINYLTHCDITINTGIMLSNYTTQQLRILRNTKRIEKRLQPNEWLLLKVGKNNNTIELIVETNVQLKDTNYFVSNDYYYVWLCAYITGSGGVNTFYDWTYETNVSDLVTSNGFAQLVGITQTFHHRQTNYIKPSVSSVGVSITDDVVYSSHESAGYTLHAPNLKLTRNNTSITTVTFDNITVANFLMYETSTYNHFVFFRRVDGSDYQIIRIVNNPTTFNPKSLIMSTPQM